MKKRIAIILSVVFIFTVFTGSVAYAANGNNSSSTTSNGMKTRSQYIEEIKPLVNEIVANKEQIKSLTRELNTVRQQAQVCIENYKEDIDSVTEEQIQEMQRIMSQIKECNTTLKNSNASMEKNRQNLRTMKQNKNYEAIKTAYKNIISIQEQRIERIQKLIELNKEILDI
ncbi:MAG: hypothetical protein R2876_07770 [Eubacteriales bacterium]